MQTSHNICIANVMPAEISMPFTHFPNALPPVAAVKSDTLMEDQVAASHMSFLSEPTPDSESDYDSDSSKSDEDIQMIIKQVTKLSFATLRPAIFAPMSIPTLTMPHKHIHELCFFTSVEQDNSARDWKPGNCEVTINIMILHLCKISRRAKSMANAL